MRTNLARRGFTLIELLVVVAIIGLLISILLPSLARAKEQARIAKCLANLRTITQAGATYVNDQDDLVFTWPLGYIVEGETQRRDYGWYTEFIWGGGVPSAANSEWDPDADNSPFSNGGADTYYYTPKERPLNEYITPGVSWDDPERVGIGQKGKARRDRPMLLPDLFKCPSDATASVPDAGSNNNEPGESDSIFRSWYFWGTSYPTNWYWPYYYQSAYSKSFLDCVGGRRLPPGFFRGYGHELLRQAQNKGAAELILFYENQMNMALQNARPRGHSRQGQLLRGWHKQQDYHVAGFLDGHAEYKQFDTRFIDGTGWTTWPKRPWLDPWKQYEDN